MLKWTTILLLTIVIPCCAEAPLGIGIVNINFNEKTIVDFYETPADQTYSKRIEFFADKSINSVNIKNLKKELSWLSPQGLWIDYFKFNLRCKSVNNDWLEVIVNNDTGKTYWIQKTDQTTLLTWEEFLKDMFAIGRLEKVGQKIKTSPSDNATDVEYEGEDCFKVKSLKGDWIEIFTPKHCDHYGAKTAIKSAWIKWKKGDKLLIEYFSTS